jgi:hypothetical protein
MFFTVDRDDSDPYEGLQREETRITLTLTVEELLLVSNAVGHAKNNMESDEFHSLIGVAKVVAGGVHEQLRAALNQSFRPSG